MAQKQQKKQQRVWEWLASRLYCELVKSLPNNLLVETSSEIRWN